MCRHAMLKSSNWQADEPSDDEDTSEDAFLQRHASYEALERSGLC